MKKCIKITDIITYPIPIITIPIEKAAIAPLGWTITGGIAEITKMM